MKKISYISRNGNELTALVVGCDRDIGITIVKEDDHEHYLYCCIGPSSPIWEACWEEENYFRDYAMAAARIETGLFDCREQFAGKGNIGQSGADTCPFGQ